MLQDREEKNFKYLAHIAKKLKISPSDFSKCILSAWRNKTSKRKDLTVTCRQEKGEAYFLFTRKDAILGQLPLPIRILQHEDRVERYLESAMRQIGETHWRRTKNARKWYEK